MNKTSRDSFDNLDPAQVADVVGGGYGRYARNFGPPWGYYGFYGGPPAPRGWQGYNFGYPGPRCAPPAPYGGWVPAGPCPPWRC